MQSKEYLKIKARKLAKHTWAGPGKFGVFIVICIIIIATFESLGLSNREKNLEIRNIPLVAVNLNLKNIEESVKPITQENLTKENTLKIKSLSDLEDNNKKRVDIMLHAAVDQYLYENIDEMFNIEENNNTNNTNNSNNINNNNVLLENILGDVEDSGFNDDLSFFDI